MLPLDSKLRRLPSNINTLQRLQFESLVFSTDTISYCRRQVGFIIEKYGKEVTILSGDDRISLFNNAWTIVDHLHIVRNLIKIILNGNMGERQSGFYAHSEVATLLRNKMDHLNTMMPNLANARGFKAPLFGVISYFLVTAADVIRSPEGDRVDRGSSVAIWAGNAVSANSLIPLPVAPSGRVRIPVSEISLYAFDLKIDFDGIINELSEMMAVMSENCYFLENDESQGSSRRVAEDEVPSSPSGQLLGEGVLVLEIELRY